MGTKVVEYTESLIICALVLLKEVSVCISICNVIV